MTKVYPKGASVPAERQKASSPSAEDAVVLTVWNKSLLPNCNGFTVFDCQGNLVFRVDSYVAGNKHEILLMDSAGRPLLTIRRKRLSLGDNWLVYEGEASSSSSSASVKPLFTARKHSGILNTKCLAQLLREIDDHPGSNKSKSKNKKKEVAYEIDGSYAQRCCRVYDSKRRKVVAEIKRKEAAAGGVAFGADVFRLVVHPGDVDTTLAMTFVILLHHMFGSPS